jgi:hypothetical protein
VQDPRTPAPPAPQPVVVTLTETGRSVLADLAGVLPQLPGDAERKVCQLDRLAKELAEAATMLCSLPGRAEWMRGWDYALMAALHSARAQGEDVGQVAASALARLDAEDDKL